MMKTLKKEGMTLVNRKLPMKISLLKFDEFSTGEQIDKNIRVLKFTNLVFL